MKRTILFLSCFCLFVFIGRLQAQDILLNSSNHNTTKYICGGYLYDNSKTGNYAANQDRWITICPQNSMGNTGRISLTFEEFDIDMSDTVFIYQGESIASPIMTTANNIPFFQGGVLQGRTVMPSLMMTSGCLTVRLKTNGSREAAGFKAKIECVSLCQYPEAALDSVFYKIDQDGNRVACSLRDGADTLVNEDGSVSISRYKSADFCMGDSIVLVAKPVFPENDNVYHQEAAGCVYEWNFGDGQSQTVNFDTEVGHKWTALSGYDLMLVVEDTANGGCRSRNTIDTRIRMAVNPIKTVQNNEICVGSETNFSVGYSENDDIRLEELNFHRVARERYENTVFVPDGPNCRSLSPTGCYNSPVTFTQFTQGATVGSADDILSVCINMEHTYLGDLGFTIICPNGQSTILKHNTHQGGADLGLATSASTCSNICSPDCNPPGIGWTYCFSNQYLDGQRGVITGHGISRVDSSNTVAMTGYFQTPKQRATNFSNGWEEVDLTGFQSLVGCPLNGEWMIRVCDDWAIDNGYVFWWDLELRQSNNTTEWSYEVPIDTMLFSIPSFCTWQSDTSFAIVPPQDSVADFMVNLKIIDDFGCSWDTVSMLTVMPVYHDTLNASICPGETYSLNGFNASQAGAYTRELQSVSGCDSVVVLELSMFPTYRDTLQAFICRGETYTLNGFNASEAGTYTQELQSVNGCDSVVVLDLNIAPVYHDTLQAEICDGELYALNGFNASETGTYVQELQNIDGCDSVVVLELSVNSVYSDTLNASICPGETYSLNGFNASQAGSYTRELQSVSGCDSVVVLLLSLNSIYHDTLQAVICQGEEYNLNDFSENEAGIYTRELQSINGCDSVVVLDLRTNPVYYDTLQTEICFGDIYTSNGFNASETGVYTQVLRSMHGCDSVVVLSLTVNPVYHDTLQAVICEGETYSLNGFSESEAGTYIQELQSVSGCDSVVVLSLNVNPVYHDTLHAAICQGETYSLNGFNASEAGTYTQELQSMHGCDSVVVLDLKYKGRNYEEPAFARICVGEQYEFGNRLLSEAGAYTYVFQSVDGCDSVVTLQLEVAPEYHDTILATIKTGEVYERYGFFESEAGKYAQYLSSQYGCDSTVVLNLRIDVDINVFVPNSFTPQRSPNDKFCIYSEESSFEIDELVIYNRYGGVIFQSHKTGECWDGTYKGEVVPQGVYKYHLIYHNKFSPKKQHRKTGSIMVFR